MRHNRAAAAAAAAAAPPHAAGEALPLSDRALAALAFAALERKREDERAGPDAASGDFERLLGALESMGFDERGLQAAAERLGAGPHALPPPPPQ